jgi:hypothetical protein
MASKRDPTYGGLGSKGRARTYLTNNRIQNLGQVGEALNLGFLNTLFSQGTQSLSPEERFALLVWAAFGVMGLFILWSMFFSPRVQRKRFMAHQRQKRLRRPWRILSLFHGSLFVQGPRTRPEPLKETRVGALFRLAGKPDMYTQCEAVSGLCYISEILQQKMPGIIRADFSLILMWSSTPAPAVSQRIPLLLAVLACNVHNRERLEQTNGAMKTLISGARAASKLKQLHALLAMAVCSKSRVLAAQVLSLLALLVQKVLCLLALLVHTFKY